MACTHHWTVTSECPFCLRIALDRAEAKIGDLAEELATLGIDRNQLLADLRKYGTHDSDCDALLEQPDVCTCGFSDALTPRR